MHKQIAFLIIALIVLLAAFCVLNGLIAVLGPRAALVRRKLSVGAAIVAFLAMLSESDIGLTASASESDADTDTASDTESDTGQNADTDVDTDSATDSDTDTDEQENDDDVGEMTTCYASCGCSTLGVAKPSVLNRLIRFVARWLTA